MSSCKEFTKCSCFFMKWWTTSDMVSSTWSTGRRCLGPWSSVRPPALLTALWWGSESGARTPRSFCLRSALLRARGLRRRSLGALCSGPAAGGFVYAVAKLNGTHISPGREASAHHTAGWSCIHKSLCPTTRLQETQDAVGSSCWWILPSLHTFPLELVRRYLSNPVYHLTPSSESITALFLVHFAN